MCTKYQPNLTNHTVYGSATEFATGPLTQPVLATPEAPRMAAGGQESLASKGPGWSQCRLDEGQLEALRAALEAGPAAHGWDQDQRWTLARAAALAGRLLGVSCTLRGTVAGMACLKPGRPGRFFYRVHVHRRRRVDRASMPEADYAALVTAAHRALNAPVVLVWDNLNAHRSEKMRQFTEANTDWLSVFRLPACAPDLNAVEGAWASMKSGLGNHAATTTFDELEAMVRRRLRDIQRRPDLINALLGQTGNLM